MAVPATAATLAIAVRSPARTSSASASPAGSISAAGTRTSSLQPSKRSTKLRSAASPPPRTASTISATSPRTDAPPGASARSAAAAPAPLSRSTRTQAPHHLVDLRRLELVRDRVGDQPRRRGEQLLAHDEPVLAQRRARLGEVDDRLDHPGQRGELDRALHLDDLRLAARLLEVGAGDLRVLRRHPNDTEPPQRLDRRIGVAGHGRQDHPGAAEAEIEQLVDAPAGLLG